MSDGIPPHQFEYKLRRHVNDYLQPPKSALPAIVTGLTIGTGSWWLLVVTAEMIAGKFGIGYFTWESYSLQKYPEIALGMLVIGVLGMISSTAVRFGLARVLVNRPRVMA